MTIGKVVDYFIREYNKAMDNAFIQKPISYALYQTWKWLDDMEKSRDKYISGKDKAESEEV